MSVREIIVLSSLVASLLGCDELSGSDGGAGHIAKFDTANGLSPGARVYVAGVRVGRVKQVALEEGKARVVFAIETNAPVPLYKDACVQIGWFGYAKEAHLELQPGSGASGAIEGGSEITCVKPSGSAAQIDAVMASMTTLLQQATSGKGTIARLLSDEALAERVAAFFAGQGGKGANAADDDKIDADKDDETADDSAEPTSDGKADGKAKDPAPAKPSPAKGAPGSKNKGPIFETR